MKFVLSATVALVLSVDVAANNLRGIGKGRCFRSDQCPGRSNICRNSFCSLGVPSTPASLTSREGVGRPAFGTCSTDADCPTFMCVMAPCPMNLCNTATNECYLEGSEESEDEDVGDTPESLPEAEDRFDGDVIGDDPILISDTESDPNDFAFNVTAAPDFNATATDRFDDIMGDDPVLMGDDPVLMTGSETFSGGNATSPPAPTFGYGAFLSALTPCGSVTCSNGLVCCSEESEICADSQDACPSDEPEVDEWGLSSKTLNVTEPSVPAGFGEFLNQLVTCGDNTCTSGFVCCSEESEIWASSKDACPSDEPKVDEWGLSVTNNVGNTVPTTTVTEELPGEKPTDAPTEEDGEEEGSVNWLPQIYVGECECDPEECLVCYQANLLDRCVEVGCPVV